MIYTNDLSTSAVILYTCIQVTLLALNYLEYDFPYLEYEQTYTCILV